jgi:hypothetical protein
MFGENISQLKTIKRNTKLHYTTLIKVYLKVFKNDTVDDFGDYYSY